MRHTLFATACIVIIFYTQYAHSQEEVTAEHKFTSFIEDLNNQNLKRHYELKL